MNDKERKFNDEIKKIKNRDQSNDNHNWVTERNVVTGFTFKGIIILSGIIAIGIIIKALFF